MNLAIRGQRVLDGTESALQAGEPVRAENHDPTWIPQVRRRSAARGRGALSMTGYRTPAGESGSLDRGTPPERMADEAIPKLMAAVPEPMRPAVAALPHLG
jgi:hypothetical protein